MNPPKANKKVKPSSQGLQATKGPQGFAVSTVDTGKTQTGDLGSHLAPLCTLDSTSNSSLGYVPLQRCSMNIDKPKLSGGKAQFPMWQIRAQAFFSKIDLGDVIDNENPDPTKNKLLYLELISLVDNESLQMIASNSPNDGKRAYELLCQYHLGDTNARMVNALHQLSLLRFNPGESVQQFICRCDVLRTTLKTFNLISNYDPMLVINAINALPDSFKIFKTIINTAPILASWDSFKMQLLNHVSIESVNNKPNNIVMQVNTGPDNSPHIVKNKVNTKYKKYVNKMIYCTICKTENNHHTKDCRKKAGGYKGSTPQYQRWSPFPSGGLPGRGRGQGRGRGNPRYQNNVSYYPIGRGNNNNKYRNKNKCFTI